MRVRLQKPRQAGWALPGLLDSKREYIVNVLQHICATSDANSEFGPRLTIESGLSRYSDFYSLGVRMADIQDFYFRVGSSNQTAQCGYLTGWFFTSACGCRLLEV